jgi:cytidylate kinase
MSGTGSGAGLLVIAVDGPSAAGKGTLAKRIAGRFNLAYLDTGLLYRGVGAALLRDGQSPDHPEAAEKAAKSLKSEDLSDPRLRGEDAASAASRVAAYPGVRNALLGFQRGFAAHPPNGPQGPSAGAVLDGRDIGTVVCPEAPVKLFVTASLEARAERRHRELLSRYGTSIYARGLEEMKERDERDRTRAVAPLAAAPDALVIDTTTLSPDAAFQVAVDHINRLWRG